MKKMNSVLSIRPIVILLCVVFLVFVMCGSAAADNYVYVPECPSGGDANVTVEESLKAALESGIYDVVVLTNNTNLSGNVIVNSSNTLYNKVNLISYYPEGLSIDAKGKTIEVPVGNEMTIGTGKQESNKHIVNISGGFGNCLFNVYGTLNINEKVNIYSNTVDDVIIVNGVNGKLNLDGGSIYRNNVSESTVNIRLGGHFTMNSGIISDNAASTKTGGVFIDTHSGFTMNGGNIINNKGQHGGGVFVDNKYRLAGEGFIMSGGNIADNYAANCGGGVYIANGGLFYQSDGEIRGNTAEFDGGGVYLYANDEGLGSASYLISKDGKIINNTAGRYGGGVYLLTDYISPEFVQSGGIIKNNTADVGGGVYLSEFNLAYIDDGYNINYQEGAKFTMNGGEIRDNIANTAGGVFVGGAQERMPENRTKFMQTIFEMSGGSIINNTGSPVVVSAGKFVMNGGSITGNNNLTEPTVIVNNTFNIDPTLNVKYKGVFEMGGGKIYDNLGNHSYVQNNKGLVYLSGGSIHYTGVNNTSTGVENYGNLSISGDVIISGFNKHGVINYGLLNISGGNIKNNKANTGAGIYSDNSIVISGGNISSNNASFYGGGIFVNGSVNMSGNSIIHDNKAKNGGGIYCENSFVMSGGTIASNTASDYGGGIFTNDSIIMTGGKISGNHANYSGAVSFRNNFDMSGGVISNNYALSGGAFSLTDIASTPMTFNFFGGGIHSNTAEDNSGIYFTHGYFNLGNSGLVDANNNVLMGSSQRINVVSDLTENSGVYSILPLTNSQQTVAVVSVPGKNAEDFIGNFDLYYKNSPSNYYNTLETSELNILTGHKYVPVYNPQVNENIPQSVYATCTVTFEPMNGENATFVSVPFNDLVSRPKDPEYGSADFLGWFTAYEYEWNFENDTVMSPLTLYAQWKGVPSQKVSPIAVPEPITDNTSEFKIPTILIAAVAAAVIAAGVVLTVVIIRKRRNSDDDYDDDE